MPRPRTTTRKHEQTPDLMRGDGGRTDVERLALAGERAKENHFLIGDLFRQLFGVEMHTLPAQTADFLCSQIELEIEKNSGITLTKFCKKNYIPVHVFRRWVETMPTVKSLWREVESGRIAQAKDRLLLVASGDADTDESASFDSDKIAVTRTLAMYDPEAKSRQEIGGDGGGPMRITVVNTIREDAE